MKSSHILRIILGPSVPFEDIKGHELVKRVMNQGEQKKLTIIEFTLKYV